MKHGKIGIEIRMILLDFFILLYKYMYKNMEHLWRMNSRYQNDEKNFIYIYIR